MLDITYNYRRELYDRRIIDNNEFGFSIVLVYYIQWSGRRRRCRV